MFRLILDVESDTDPMWVVAETRDGPAIPTGRSTRMVKVSPDGGKLACLVWDPAADRMALLVLSIETGKVLKNPTMPRNDDIPFLDWSRDGENLYAVLRRAGPVSLWRIPVNGGQPAQLGQWRNELNLHLRISGIEPQLFYEIEAA